MRIESIAKLFGFGIAAIFGLTIFFGSWYTIDQGDRGVVLTNGAITGEVGPGLHFKMPMVQAVEELSFRSQQTRWDGQYSISSYTRDKQVATVHMTVNWRISNASKVYGDYRGLDGVRDQIIVPKALEIFKNAFGQIDSTQAITKREALNADVLADLTQAVVSYPVTILSVQVTDISFSDEYDAAVAAQMKEQIGVLQAKASQQRQNINADTAAYQVEAEARAAGNASKLRGEGEAAAIEARGRAIRENPQVTALLYAEAANKWDGALPTTMPPGTTLPILNLGK